MPLIKDLLQAFGSKTKWNLDLKSGDIEDDLIQVIKELSLQNRVVLSGLKLSNAKRILATNPNLNVVINLSRVDRAILSMRLLPSVGGGRVAMYEIMIANQGIRNLIKDAKDHQIESALEQGKSEGMKTFNMSIGELLGHHKISKDTADMHTGTLSK